MRGRIFALAAVAILMMGGVAALDAGHQESVRSNEAQTVDNETWTVDTGNWVQLDAPGGDGATYSEAADVEVRQNGTVINESGNWSWDSGDARIKALDGGELVDGNESTVTYAYYEPSGAQQATQDLSLIPLSALGEVWPFILGLIVLFGSVAVFARQA